MKKDNRNEKRGHPLLAGFVPALLAVSVAVTGALQCRFIYGRAIDTFRLTEVSGLSKERLMENYRILVEYNTPFGSKELSHCLVRETSIYSFALILRRALLTSIW